MSGERVLVTGAAGALGRALTTLLVQAGARVHGTDRDPLDDPRTGLASFRQADVVDLPWGDELRGVDAVFHLAAFVHRRPTQSELDRVDEVNHRTTARIARGCRESGAFLVFASTIAVLEAGRRTPCDEPSPDGLTPYGRSKWLAEQAVRAEGARGLRYVILRFPLLYGPGGRGNMERLLSAIARRRYWPIGDCATPKTCMHLRDAARACVEGWRHPRAVGGTFVVAPASTPTLGDIHAAAYATLGRRPPMPLPTWPVVAAARIVDAVARTSLRHQVTTLSAPSRHDGRAFSEATGFEPAVSLEEGIQETMRWVVTR